MSVSTIYYFCSIYMLLLHYDADIRTLAFVSIYFALAFTLWHHDVNSWLMAIGLVPLCIFSFIGAVATHNAMHLKVFKNELMNIVWRCILGLTYGHPGSQVLKAVSTFVPGHNISHHAFTQLRRDMMRTSKVNYKWHFVNAIM
jgi:hypothetical protein